jgi:hypothetical protein
MMGGWIFHFALMSFCLQRQLQQIFRVPKNCDLFSLIRLIIMRLSCCKCNSCRVLYYLLFFNTPATPSCLVYYVEFSCMRSITRSDGWLFGEDVCRERERDDHDDFGSRVRGRCRQGTITKAIPLPPPSFPSFLRNSRPSVVAATAEAPTRNINTRKGGKLPMDKKNEVHIPGPHTRS